MQTTGVQASTLVCCAPPSASITQLDPVCAPHPTQLLLYMRVPCCAVVSAAFVRNEPPPEQNDAHWLLDFYSSFMSCSAEDTTERALECLAKVCGGFGRGFGGATCCREQEGFECGNTQCDDAAICVQLPASTLQKSARSCQPAN